MKKNLLLLAATAMMLVGCQNGQNEAPQEPVTKQQAIKTYFGSPVAFNGTFVESSNALLRASKSQPAGAPAILAEGSSYPAYSWTPQDGTWPIDVTVDYGSEGVIAADGLQHKGQMAIHATARFEEEGSVLTPTFTDFFVYNNILNAEQTIKNLGKNASGNLVFDVTVNKGYLGAQKQLIYSERTSREMIAGLLNDGTLDPVVTNHTYSITGWMKTASTVDTIPGCEATIDNQQPMVIAVGDSYPTAGKLSLTFDKQMSYSVQGMTANYSAAELEFTGKANGEYGATVTIEFTVVTVKKTLQLTFRLDENGIIPESIIPTVQ